MIQSTRLTVGFTVFEMYLGRLFEIIMNVAESVSLFVVGVGLQWE